MTWKEAILALAIVGIVVVLMWLYAGPIAAPLVTDN